MPQKKVLSQEDIEEIEKLRGKISPQEARKRFGIGTTRLYRIWDNAIGRDSVVEKNSGEEEKNIDLQHVYTLLRQIEILQKENNTLQKENKNISVDILSLLDVEEEDNVVEELQAEIEEVQEGQEKTLSIVEKIKKAIQTCRDIQEIASYLPFVSAIGVVLYKTWKNTPPAVPQPRKQPPPIPKQQKPSRGDPFYME